MICTIYNKCLFAELQSNNIRLGNAEICKDWLQTWFNSWDLVLTLDSQIILLLSILWVLVWYCERVKKRYIISSLFVLLYPSKKDISSGIAIGFRWNLITVQCFSNFTQIVIVAWVFLYTNSNFNFKKTWFFYKFRYKQVIIHYKVNRVFLRTLRILKRFPHIASVKILLGSSYRTGMCISKKQTDIICNSVCCIFGNLDPVPRRPFACRAWSAN